MSEIQRVCGTARVSYMCACGDVDFWSHVVLCAKWLHCALVLSQESVSECPNTGPCVSGARGRLLLSVAVCLNWCQPVSVCVPVLSK